MKNLKYLLFGILVMFVLNVNVNADMTEVKVKTASELATCLTTTGNYCILEEDIKLNSSITIDDALVYVDLNGHNITSDNDLSMFFYVKKGELEITGKGKITAKNYAVYVSGDYTPGSAARKAILTVDKDVTVESEDLCAILIVGNGAKAIIKGTVKSLNNDYAAISGNGTKNTSTDYGNTEIIVEEGALIEAEGSHGVYHPQNGKLTVNGGTIKGVTGIEMRAGELIINGGEIIATANETTVTPNGSGSSVNGAAVVLSQHTTIQALKLEINGGTLKGATALYETTPENPNDETIIDLKVSGGEFIATSETGNAIYSENKTSFVEGGIFSKDLNKELLSENLESVKAEDGTYLVGERHKVAVKENEGGKVVVDKATAIYGENVTITITPNEGYKIKEIKVNGQVLKNAKFVMPNEDVEVEVAFEKVPSAPVNVTTNPKTNDAILTYGVVGLLSLLGLSVTLKHKREN